MLEVWTAARARVRHGKTRGSEEAYSSMQNGSAHTRLRPSQELCWPPDLDHRHGVIERREYSC